MTVRNVLRANVSSHSEGKKNLVYKSNRFFRGCIWHNKTRVDALSRLFIVTCDRVWLQGFNGGMTKLPKLETSPEESAAAAHM